jgi:hypothetical protein
VKTLPAVREAIEQRKWTLAEASTLTVGQVLETESNAIKAATEKLRAVAPAEKSKAETGKSAVREGR